VVGGEVCGGFVLGGFFVGLGSWCWWVLVFFFFFFVPAVPFLMAIVRRQPVSVVSKP